MYVLHGSNNSKILKFSHCVIGENWRKKCPSVKFSVAASWSLYPFQTHQLSHHKRDEVLAARKWFHHRNRKMFQRSLEITKFSSHYVLTKILWNQKFLLMDYSKNWFEENVQVKVNFSFFDTVSAVHNFKNDSKIILLKDATSTIVVNYKLAFFTWKKTFFV